MKKNLLLIFIIGWFALGIFGQTDKRIEEIKKIYLETNKKVADCQENGEYSSVFLSELTVNKNNGSYPAVGIYNSIFKFYYTYGDREKNPYPNRLLKIEIETKRSANIEKFEYLFNLKGQLIFYFEKKEVVEKRLYFVDEKPIRMLIGDKQFNIEKEYRKKVNSIFTEKKRLLEIFNNSLEF
ncbi:MAG TPA: hypothetical protein PKE69_23285 [Pyrinomonadaceae bacterium]|nr:hypothetical protein [Pyrinomonadaceae bacterium]